MKGLAYQLKSVRKDKFCIMSFLLPIVAAIVLNAAGSMDFSVLDEYHFGVTDSRVTPETKNWLAGYGTVAVCQTRDELISAINDPDDNLIGVEMDENGIKTILSGDEPPAWQEAAATLPALYSLREIAAGVSIQALDPPETQTGLSYIFMAVTLITAMFMGCTFNAMNIISEKEDGTALINEILPMTSGQYVMQKIFIGFVFGCLSAAVTAAVCFRLSPAGASVMLALIVLSAFASSFIGLLIGCIADGMMTGIVYIKVVMLVFLAVPLLKYLAAADSRVLSCLCFLIPSSATFEGVLDLAGGGMETAGRDIAVLMAHGAGWLLLYLLFSKIRKNTYK